MGVILSPVNLIQLSWSSPHTGGGNPYMILVILEFMFTSPHTGGDDPYGSSYYEPCAGTGGILIGK